MKQSELVGLPIMAMREGRVQGNVLDTIVDAGTRKVTYFILRKDSKYDLLLLAAADIVGAGPNYLIIPEGAAVRRIYAEPSRMETVTRGFYLTDARAISEDGQILGDVTDFDFSPQTGELISICVADQESFPAEAIVMLSGSTVFLRTDPEHAPRTVSADLKEDPEAEETEEDAGSLEGEDTSWSSGAPSPEFRLKDAWGSGETPRVEQTAGQSDTITQKYFRNLLVGKTLADNVVSADGAFRVEKGTVITEWHMQLAEQHDAVTVMMKHIEPI